MSAERATEVAGFLARAGYGDARLTQIKGDVSARRYARLSRGCDTAILMDIPAHADEDTVLFRALSEWLCEGGLSAPRVLASEPDKGLSILEDFGEALYARTCDVNPSLEAALYDAAIDAIVHLHGLAHETAPDIPAYDPEFALSESRLALEWFVPWRLGRATTAAEDAAFTAAFAAEITPHLAEDVVVLRDYHAENLFWLPERAGPARVGIIDFQGARRGAVAYDLASLLTDARRDVSPAVRARAVARYCRETGHDHTATSAAIAALSVQRNLKILGIFARLATRDGRADYLSFIPRVIRYLTTDLATQGLTGMAAAVAGIINDDTVQQR